MHPSTALATVLVDELVRRGVREAVLSPGSRSAPVAFALHEADRAGRLRLHVRIDERSAGFLALGLAKASGRPVVVLTTSGTAAVNLHPAVVEASYAHVPLIALTADRPPELRGIGANQTIDQPGLYGPAARWAVDVPPADRSPGQVEAWRAVAGRAVEAAAGGPVQVNLGLREPLTPSGGAEWVEPLGLGAAPPTDPRPAAAEAPADVGDLPRRGVMVLADGAAPVARRAGELAAALGWPVLAEPTSGGRTADALGGYGWLLSDERFAAAHVPDLVLVVGRPTLSRSVAALLRSAREHWVVDLAGDRPDPTATARRFLSALPRAAGGSSGDDGWLQDWVTADRVARAAVDRALDAAGPVGARVARDLVAALPAGSTLFVGSSQAIRDVDLFAPPRDGLTVLANRGSAGIDGTVSSAVGAALAARGPAYALMGDLTF
ncbi:MAG TPA: 2-succinyl-5-enolpyruvyl-6-hydroxy-3-cyclohexene-1-carboxylic-acid synthase, partial [Candidatus Eisenbacteria bacterium]|nr:2-succinyl-5-enolpyruvyl-6-hydroxy-3-cyclohexene-1-carboxylic-acid synthase [Candidatus Eisenbacteria bacterium]